MKKKKSQETTPEKKSIDPKKKKRKVAIASALTFGGITAVVGAAYGVTNYFVNYAIMRPEPNGEEDTRAPSYDKSEVERENIARSDAKVAEWKENFPPETVSMESFDGLKLVGYLYENPEPSDYWVVAVHGYQSDHTSVEDYAEEYFSRNYNVLIPDLRGHGFSEGDYIGMGYHDSQDILQWLDFILERNPNAKIVLHGQSMGAATVMITAGQPSLPENVFTVIEDCGYTDSYQMMVEQLEYRYGLPPFPLMPMTNKMAELRTNYDLKEASPLDFLKDATVPILFIHGDNDTFVLPYMQDILYDAYTGEKEKLTIAGADHVASRNVEYDLYYNTVFDFIDKYKN